MSEIGVIVPVYKVEPYLHRCIESILAQTFTDFELILVDDGSPDNCGKICDEYAQRDKRVHVIHQENGGLSVARNAGLDWMFANSSSKWITFIDSDDWVLPQYLELLIKAANEYQVLISMCWLYHTSGDEPVIKLDNVYAVLRSNVEAYSRNGKEIAAYAQGRIYAAELFQDIRFPAGRLFEDIFITHRICFSQKYIAVIEHGLYCYYENPNGIVQSQMTLRKAKDKFDAYEEQIDFFFTEGYEDIGKMQVRRYLNDMVQLIQDIKRKPQRNRDLQKMLHQKKRERFPEYAKRMDISIESDAWILTKVFPIRMNAYWYWRALCKKMKHWISW